MNATDQKPKQENNTEQDTIYSWASFCHFSALFGLLVWIPTDTLWIPVCHILGPLAVWLWKRKQADIIDFAGKEALNFQITISICGLAAFLLSHDIMLSSVVIALTIYDILMVCIAGVRSSRGEFYRYPGVPIRLIK